jgi:hypothetical protein
MKKIIVIFVFLTVLMTSFVSVQAATYTSYTGAPANQAYFDGIVKKLKFDEHYVCFRTSNYINLLVWGDLELLNSTTIIGNGIVNIAQYESQYGTYTFRTESNFRVNISTNSLFLSDLGNYSSMTIEREGTHDYIKALCIGFCVFFVFYVNRDIFRYCLG